LKPATLLSCCSTHPEIRPQSAVTEALRVLRDENGTAISTQPEAELAKKRLMEIVNKENEVKALRSIQHAIDDKEIEIAGLEAEQIPRALVPSLVNICKVNRAARVRQVNPARF